LLLAAAGWGFARQRGVDFLEGEIVVGVVQQDIRSGGGLAVGVELGGPYEGGSLAALLGVEVILIQEIVDGIICGDIRGAEMANAKEFAFLAGISYSAAREGFRLPGFPVFRGFVFWQDFTDWRRARARVSEGSVESTPAVGVLAGSINARDLPARAAQILLEA
jgi:hypothetical protein